MATLYRICPDDGIRNPPAAVECNSCGRLLRDVRPAAAGAASSITGAENSPLEGGAGEPEHCNCVVPTIGPGLCATCLRIGRQAGAGDAAESDDAIASAPDDAPDGEGHDDPAFWDAWAGSSDSDGTRRRGSARGDSSFVLKLGGHFNISSSLLLIGRSCGQTPTEIDHYLRNTPGVSRRHCLIVGGSTAITVVDLASTNGTFVGSRRVSPGEPCRIDRQQLPVSLGLGSGVLCMIEARS